MFNHTVTHPHLTRLSYADVLTELGAPGIQTTYGRPPYGQWNTTVQNAYAAKEMRIWLWNLDTFDYNGYTATQVVSTVVNGAKPGDAVLMHMNWNAFNGPAIRAMKAGLAERGIGVCRNQGVQTPQRPTALVC